jgi:hypothetical protein
MKNMSRLILVLAAVCSFSATSVKQDLHEGPGRFQRAIQAHPNAPVPILLPTPARAAQSSDLGRMRRAGFSQEGHSE